jgi:hypothetical protein
MKRNVLLLTVVAVVALLATPVLASPFFFSTGNVDGRMATASRPDINGFEIESADDFVLTSATQINHATFTGLLKGTVPLSNIGQVGVEIYRVFPLDSDVTRTSGPPDFSTVRVPTRVNSPSDDALATRDTTAGNLSFKVSSLGTFTVLNSVQAGGIHPKPGQFTAGNGPVTGQEVVFDITFLTPFTLPADHYFFVPQVEMTGGDFLWLSAPKPIVPPGTPFLPDLQSWTRDQFLDPDWLRIGTDITGQGPFNAAFSLDGDTIPVPEPSTLLLLGIGIVGIAGWRRRRTR